MDSGRRRCGRRALGGRVVFMSWEGDNGLRIEGCCAL